MSETPAPTPLAPATGSPFDFTPRHPGRSFAAKGSLKEWPDEWVCETCAWVKPSPYRRKRVYCCKWKFGIYARSDRACYEERGEMKDAREALANDKLSDGGGQ